MKDVALTNCNNCDSLQAQTDRLKWWHNMTNQEMRLHAGELSAQEVRAVRAVLANIFNAGVKKK